MNSRQRVKKAINHQETDKVPIDLGGCKATGISAIAYGKLLKKLGIKEEIPKLYDFMQQLAFPGPNVREIFNIDVITPGQFFLKEDNDWIEFKIPYDGTKCLIPKYWYNLYDIEIDKNQMVLIKHKDGTIFGMMPKSSRVVDQAYWSYSNLINIPEVINLDEIFSKHLWMIPGTLDIVRASSDSGSQLIINGLKELYEKTDHAIIYDVGGNIFDIGFTLRGIDGFLIDIYKDKKEVQRLVNALYEKSINDLEDILKILKLGKYIDVLVFYDDIAYQTASFIPAEKYREIFKPYHKKMWDYVHSNSECAVCLHCCGAAYELLPDFIEAGMDIFNPVQINSVNMEPKKLKKEFGKYITFWGAGCDPKSLAIKSPKEIKEEVKRNIDIFSKGGGYVFSSIHNITAEVPPENVIAMFEAANEYGRFI